MLITFLFVVALEILKIVEAYIKNSNKKPVETVIK